MRLRQRKVTGWSGGARSTPRAREATMRISMGQAVQAIANRRRARALGCGAAMALAAVFLGGCSSSPGTRAIAPQIERRDQEFDLDKSIARVEIVNRHGEINVRGNDESAVGIHAVIQRMPPDLANAELRSRREGDTLRIEAVFPRTQDDRAGRIDLAVYVPASLAIALTTRAGRIAARKRQGPLEATTESGEILASSHARLALHSGSGQIRAIAIGKRWNGESRVSTDSGRIVLLVPTFGDIALDAQTGGRLSTDFGLSVQQSKGLSSARAHYGAGSSALVVRSGTGEVVLAQLVLMGDDSPAPEDDD
jgi:hypothetical protein